MKTFKQLVEDLNTVGSHVTASSDRIQKYVKDSSGKTRKVSFAPKRIVFTSQQNQ
jgi:hypothetical protein